MRFYSGSVSENTEWISGRIFFSNVKKRQSDFEEAKKCEGKNAERNRRYQLSIECFDALDEINFKDILMQNEISLKIDIKSLELESPDWNRKLR